MEKHKIQNFTFRQIDIEVEEGQLLFAALIILTTQVFTDKTPDEVVEKLKEIAEENNFFNTTKN